MTFPQQEGKWTNGKKPLLIPSVESGTARVMEMAEAVHCGTGLGTVFTWSKAVLTPRHVQHTVCGVGG